MTHQEGLAHLAGLAPSSIKMGLARVEAALARLGHPQRRLPALHVAGTNGKGSTCAIAASCLSQRYRVGLYTSPHLERVNERIQIDGVPIDDMTLGWRVGEVLEVLGVDHQLTYFEFGTVVAFWHFAREAVDLAVLETGLGGRLDATTACQPVVTCVTPVDFDHQEHLGATLEAIAREKAGIVKPGVPLVLSRQRPEALAQFQPTWLEGRDFEATRSTYQGWAWRLEDLELPLRGPHQAQNLGVALACLEALAGRGFPLTEAELRQGVRETQWPGRLELFPGAPPVLLDGAHNPAGVEVLRAALDGDFAGRPVHLVFGVFADKDWEPMLRRLLPRVAAAHLTPVASPRSLEPTRALALARALCPDVQAHPDAETALAAARAGAPPEALVVVAGSLNLVGQLRGQLAAAPR